MKLHTNVPPLSVIIILHVALWAPLSLLAADSQTNPKPILLYSRYFNAEGETRYLPEGNYKDVLDRLGADFQVRVHNKPLTRQSLADVKLLLIANPSDKPVGTHPAPPHFARRDYPGPGKVCPPRRRVNPDGESGKS